MTNGRVYNVTTSVWCVSIGPSLIHKRAYYFIPSFVLKSLIMFLNNNWLFMGCTCLY